MQKAREIGAKLVTRQTRAVALGGLLVAVALGGTLGQRPRSEETGGGAAAAPPVEARPSQPVWDLPNPDHARVDHFVEVFQGSQRKYFTRYLERMGRYQPMISAKLAERGMPQDLIYLALIESGFNPTAYSRAHASGLWQFISETGRYYGLEVNRAVDERNDPEQATDAALEHLQDLYDRFGSWYLAAAAYNSGAGRVGRVMRRVTGSERGDEGSYWKIREHLPRETRDYVPLMIAAARIAKEPDRYGFGHVKPEPPLVADSVVVEPATPLQAIARAAETTVDELRRLNPHLKLHRTRNDVPSAVRVPAGASLAFALNWPTVREDRVAQAEPEHRRYRIRRGDSLIRIARRHGVSVAAIKRANGLRGSRIRAGSVLRIPVSS